MRVNPISMSHSSLAKHCLIICAAAAIVGCGGSSGSGSGGTSDSANLYTFYLSPSTFNTPATGTTNITADWNADATGLPAITEYGVKAHIIPATAPDTPLTDQNLFLSRGCNPGAPCHIPEVLVCTLSSTGALTCPYTFGHVQVPPGAYIVVAHACYFAQTTFNEVCSSKIQIPVTVN